MTAELSRSERTAPVERLLAHRAFLAVLFLSFLIVAAYFESWSQVAAAWSDDTSRVSHGWLALVAIVAILFVNLPHKFGPADPKDRWRWYVLGLLASLTWFALTVLSVESLAEFAALAVLASAMHLVFDRATAREIDRCLLVMCFTLPMLEAANGHFQTMSITVAATVLHWMGVPAELNGFEVHLPAGTFWIEPLCSGLQFFIAATTTGALLAAMRRESWVRTFWVIAGAGAIGLLANWLRVITVITVGYLTDMQHYLVHSEHFTLGWSLFALGIVSYVVWISRKPWPAAAPARSDRSAVTGTSFVAACSPALLLLAAPALLLATTPRAPSPRPIEPAEFAAAPWRGPMASWAEWAADNHEASRRIVADYLNPGGTRITAFVARYDVPERTAAAFISVTGFLPAPDWQVDDAQALQIDPTQGAALGAQRSLVRNSAGQRWVFVHWYRVGPRAYASALQARVANSRARLTGASSPFLLLVFASQCASDCLAESSAAQALASAAAVPLISQILE